MRVRILASLAAAALVAACSNDLLKPIASTDNKVDTITLGALHFTPVQTPSAFSVLGSSAVRTDQLNGPNFDFLYDIDSIQGPAFYPAEVTGVLAKSSTNPALKRVNVAFDSIKSADLNGYVNDALQPIDSGDVFLVRSLITCAQGVPTYGKLEVLGIDAVAHTVTFQVLVDDNCGYRGLQPGLPKN